MMQKFLNQEEIRLMQCHKWMESQKAGHDVGEEAFTEWALIHEEAFMQWADKLPEHCIHCGLKCHVNGTKCIQPFDKRRINFMGRV